MQKYICKHLEIYKSSIRDRSKKITIPHGDGTTNRNITLKILVVFKTITSTTPQNSNALEYLHHRVFLKNSVKKILKLHMVFNFIQKLVEDFIIKSLTRDHKKTLKTRRGIRVFNFFLRSPVRDFIY